MSKYIFWLLLLSSLSLNAQITISGEVLDTSGFPIEDAEVTYLNQSTITDENGYFSLEVPKVNKKEKIIVVDSSGILNEFYTPNPEQRYFKLYQKIEFNCTFPGLIINWQKHRHIVQNSDFLNAEMIQKDNPATLAQALEKTPGIQAQSIGSGSAKPIIRGMGLNRIAISENGIKQESQQWGADHGLEIDALGIDEVEIIKGAAALEYGSDAIAGVIALKSNQTPTKYGLSADINLFGASNNELLGSAFRLTQKNNKFFYKINGKYAEYADYKVPAHSFQYESMSLPLYHQRLSNTAGLEKSVQGVLGITEQNFESQITLSNFYQKTGFFPISHGLHDEDEWTDDGNKRNIGFPYQNVNHFKAQSWTKLKFYQSSLEFLLAFQNNHRQEWNEFHQHYGEEHEHDDEHHDHGSEDLELDFKLSTYDSQLKYEYRFSSNNRLNIGVQSQYQKNQINGYSFLMPAYSRFNQAVYAIHIFEISPKINLNYGLRYDYFNLKTDEFFDHHLEDYLIDQGYSQDEAESLSQRSEQLNKSSHHLNYSLGMLYSPTETLDFNLNLASSFRVPTAIELASNGIHHGSFRHELGNPDLKAEKGWTSDLRITYHNAGWRAFVNPYLYYFDNYIFLYPTGENSPLPSGEKMYQYQEAEALMTGFEVGFEKKFWNRLEIISHLEYQYNHQKYLSAKEALPMSPPLSIKNELTYTILKDRKWIADLEVYGQMKWNDRQNKIAQDELTTPASAVFSAGLNSTLYLGKIKADVNFSVHNLTNKKYYNHLSYYRAFDIPEMGRNFRLSLRFGI